MNLFKRTGKKGLSVLLALGLLSVFMATASAEDLSGYCKLTAPANAKVSVANIPSYYTYNAVSPYTVQDNGDGTKSWYYNIAQNSEAFIWRASLPGKVTQSGWGLTYAGVTADFDSPGKDNPGDTVTSPAGIAGEDSGSMHLNINASNFLQLSSQGDTYRLYALRAWEIIEGAMYNKAIPPDYYYEPLVGEDVVSIVPDDDMWLSHRSTVTALQEGTAIYEITYDAIDAYSTVNSAVFGAAAPNGRYGAVNPERKGIAVITVGAIAQGDVKVHRPWDAAGTFTSWDSEGDTWYFTGNSEEITVQPTAANVTSVQAWNPDAQDDWVALTGGKLTLYPGNNIVKVTVQGGLSYYKVIRGNTVKVVSNAGNRPLQAGDQVQVLWGGNIPAYPLAKLAGIYNPGTYNLYNAWDDTFTVTQAMIDRSILDFNVDNSDHHHNYAEKNTVTIAIRCGTILNNMGKLRSGKERFVPSNGIIMPAKTVSFTDGETVFNVLQRETRAAGIQMEFSNNPMFNSVYIEGINNLYEFDCGELSGWMYKVNGWFPNYGCSQYKLKQGDVIEWVYTCDLGNDVGGGYATGAQG